jgi:hypothetical protein
MYPNSHDESVSSAFARRKRFVGRNNRTTSAWQNYFCIENTASHIGIIMPTFPAARHLLAVTLAVLVPLAAAPTARALPDPVSVPAAEPAENYADVADLVLKSPVIADAIIRGAEKLKGPDAVGAAPGHLRLLITADITNAVRADAALPPQISYLLDVAVDQKGHLPKLKKLRVLLFARHVSAYPNQLQLTGDSSQRVWSAPLDALTRKITAAVLAPAAPPTITGIGNAFHVAGSLPGEGETQVFLTTADNRPVSLTVLSRPGEQKKWAVALSEVVDETAAPPPPDTLLWYRLACFLPRTLPDHALAADDPDNAAAARLDYQFVLQALGPCGRTTKADSGKAG